MNEKKPQHVNPGLDVTCDPTFHPDTYRSAKHLPRPEHCDHECVCEEYHISHERHPCRYHSCPHNTRTKTSDVPLLTDNEIRAIKQVVCFAISEHHPDAWIADNGYHKLKSAKTSDALAETKDIYPFSISDDDLPAFNLWLKAHDQQVRKGGRS